MPFVNAKVTVELNNDKKNSLKEKIARALETHLGKSENVLMVGFEDNYCLYFKGNMHADSAFIEIAYLGKASPDKLNSLTYELTNAFSSVLGITQSRIYIKYEEVTYWGFNGSNF